MKIPTLLTTTKGTLIVFAEARNPDCGDFSSTTLVYKRSTDDGQSWSALAKLAQQEEAQPQASTQAPRQAQGLCGRPPVVGNAAPVQLRADSRFHPGRILVPHVRNNYAVWQVHSDDDGMTWSPARSIPNVVNISSTGPDCNRKCNAIVHCFCCCYVCCCCQRQQQQQS